MVFENFSEEEIRSICRQSLETLEYWLRLVIDEGMTINYGINYLNASDNGGNSILPLKRVTSIADRQYAEKNRYKRIIDAALLDDLITIICHPLLYKPVFIKYFQHHFPNGVNEFRNILNKLIEPRNRLSHANPISHRQAEQVICYSNDIIDSIKFYYSQSNLHMEFNVPRIIRFKDSFGNEIHFAKSGKFAYVNLLENKEYYLRPGDTLSIEVEIDNSFEANEYTILWQASNRIPDFGNTNIISIKIEEHHIGEEFCIQGVIISNKAWHRLHGLYNGYDDVLSVNYRVLSNFYN